MSYRTTLPVRFSDVDPAGIAFYPTLVSFLHVAFEQFFEEFVEVPYARTIQEERLGFPAVDLKMQFFAPLRFGDKVTIEVSVLKLGRSSSVFRYSLTAAGKPRAQAEVTVVAVGLDDLKPIPIPTFYREAFQRALATDD